MSETTNALPEVSPVADSLQQKHEDGKASLEKVPSSPANNSLDSPEKKRRGRPPKVAGQGPKAVTPSRKVGATATETAAASVDAAVEAAQRKEVALMAVDLVEQSGTMLGGEEAKMRDTEKVNITSSIERYMVSKNMSDIPPGLMLTISLAMYYSRAARAKEAEPKLVRFALWAKSKFSRGKKFDARSHSRDDDERKNDAGEKAGGSV